ncbi:MAG: hypothetical protein KF878_34640 [Planctomycetes bacterium]|nr:hypothetical protein [Planctomycetota bacterium]
MSNLARPSELHNAVRTLVGYVDDLRRANFHDGSTKLRLVVNYCQKDQVVRALSEQLRARVPTDVLHERTSGDALRLPAGARDRLAFAHTLLYHLKQGWKLELRELITRTFQGAGVDARWEAFQRLVVGAYAEGMEAVLRQLEALPGEGLVDVDATFREALAALGDGDDCEPNVAGGAAAGATDAGAGASSAAPRGEPLPPAAPDLLAAIDRTGLLEDDARDLRVDARIVALELRKARPSPDRLAELEGAFLAVSPALGAAFRGALGGQAAYVREHGGASVRDADARRAAEGDDGDADDDPARRRPPAGKTKAPTTKKPVAVAASPASKRAAAGKEAPATKKAATTKKSAATEKAATTKKSAATRKAARTKKTSATEKAATTKKSAATRKAATTKKTSATKKSAATRKASATKKASANEKTGATKKRAKQKAPAAKKRPSAAKSTR